MNSHYVHKEEILQPSDRGTFIDGNTYHNLSFGEIPEANSFHIGFQIGFGYEVPLDKKKSMIASPEIFYSYNFTPIAKGISWTVHSIRAGIALKYKQPPPPPPPPVPPMPPPHPKLPLPVEPPVLSATVQLVKVDSTGKQDKNFNIKIEDFISLNMRPLLNYIFFDSNSAEIPVRYKKLKKEETKDFSIKNLQNLGAMDTYYQVLNIIGMRLRAYPDAKIEIVGCNANNGDEKNNLDLSRNRAVIVRDYLRDVWEIDGLRMPVKARNLPDKSTRNDEPGGDEENRRAEIITDDLRIIEPVTTVDTLRVVDEYNLKFLTDYKSAVGIKKWELKAVYDNKNIYEASGEGNPTKDLDWKLNGKLKNTPKNAGNIFYYVNVTDSLGQNASSAKNRLPIERLTIDRKRLERIADKEFEYYSLILFDFGKSDLRLEHKKVVDFVKDRIVDNSKVYVRGYTDSMGDEEINKRISDKRAKAVSDRIKIPGIEAFGIGEADLLYPNNTPEGRFYCRTVQIVIETPVTE
jgi:outer membrane protein OmpA-like peptidoglycan-associated protein